MEPTALDIVTLVIAVVGAVTGIGALFWNIAEFRLTGPRVKVRIQAAMLSKPMGTAIVGPVEVWQQTSDPRFDEQAVGIEVRNVGRFPATVQKYQVNLTGGAAFSYMQSLVGPPVPHRLEPGDKETWYIELHAVAATQAAFMTMKNGNNAALRASVELGTGRSIESENSIIIPTALLP